MKNMVSSKWLVVSGLLAILVQTLTIISCSDDSSGGGNSYTCQLSPGTCIQTTSVSDCTTAGGFVVDADACQTTGGGSSSSVPSGDPSSSSVASSSSVGTGGSSSSVGVVVGTGCSIDGYRTVVIGTQTWMAENYNCAVSGSKCGNKSSGILTENSADCNEYGRLYDWATAMDLPSSCNSTSCSGQVQARHRGICPDGWHVPSNGDWDILMKYVDAENGGTGSGTPYDSYTAGTHLKAANGWNPYDGIENLDTYGFAALPAGLGNSVGNFYSAGYYGYWWSASENYESYAYLRFMDYNYEYAGWGNDYKYVLFSLRCVKDN